MTIEHGLFWIALLVFGWACLRHARSVAKRERARALLEDVRDLRKRNVWYARLALHKAYEACYDAGMIEEYQNLHEWFYGRSKHPRVDQFNYKWEKNK